MTPSRRVLRVSFSSADEFQREHAANLENGGIFVATDQVVELRESVEIELALAGCREMIRIEGETVHVVPPEMAQTGAEPGVAVQFSAGRAELRAALEPFVRLCGGALHAPPDPGRRIAPRVPSQVPVHIETAGEVLAGHTRNISQSGVLISVPGEGIPEGERVSLMITHPTSADVMTCHGIVTRQVRIEGGVVALAIEFDPTEDERQPLSRFIRDLQSVEQTRRLGGIRGSIAAVGPLNLLQMFGKTAPRGTLTLRRGDEEAVVGFEAERLHYARLGSASGIKALVRVLCWSDGLFEFHARLEPVETARPLLPLEAALLEATRQLDELERLDLDVLPDDATVRFVSDPAGPAAASTPKVEQAVLDLARAGSSVRRMLDVIPDPDPVILRAITFLADLGSIAIIPK